jgi:hypothetical protein
MNRNNERGIALLLTLFLTAAISLLAASLITLAQSETYASLNYRMMSQARYGAEAGAHKAVNHLLNTYTAPATTGTDLLSAYDLTKSPVTLAGGTAPIILSADASIASNYPDATKQSAFAAAGAGSLSAGSATVSYTASAKLISMQSVTAFGSGTAVVVQTWEITASGAMAGSTTATVQVTSTLEQQVGPASMYGTFATANTCGAMKFTTGSLTNSYDSSTYIGPGVPPMSASGGNVGTNGNLAASGGATINGTLSTPRVGVGSCSAGNVTAATASGGATVTGGIIQLPQPVTLPTPAAPTPAPPTTPNTIDDPSTCASAGILSLCTGSAGNLTITPTAGTAVTLGDLSITNMATLHLKAGTYNINSLTMSGGTLYVDSGPVILNVVGASRTAAAPPISLTGGDIINPTYDATKLQIMYGGTLPVIARAGVSGGAGAKNGMLLYAPNAPVTFSQGGDFFGAIVASTFDDQGVSGVQIHYDRRLNGAFMTPGNFMMTSFNWKKY